MSPILDLYVAQPFWIWLGVGVLLLAVEAAFSTEWLLWPAVSAGVVAVLTALGLRWGFGVELGIFAALTVVSTLLSRRLIQRVNPANSPISTIVTCGWSGARPRWSRPLSTAAAGSSSRAPRGRP